MNINLSCYSSHLWDCVGCKEFHTDTGELFGRIYYHRIKKEYDFYNNSDVLERILKIHELNKTVIYPAKEPAALDLLIYHPKGEEIISSFQKKINDNTDYTEDYKDRCNEYIHSFREMIAKNTLILDTLFFLGYRFKLDHNGGYFASPDHIFLQNKWKQVQKKHPQLPDLKIAAVNGLLDSDSFIKMQLENNAILSYGTEYIHDHYIHITPLIILMIVSQNMKIPTYYSEIRTKFNRLLKDHYELIQDLKKSDNAQIEKSDLKKLEFIFSIFTDTILSIRNFLSIQRILSSFYDSIILIAQKKNPYYERSIQETFPDGEWNPNDLITRLRTLFKSKQNPNLIA